jgi:hypothetical protein
MPKGRPKGSKNKSKFFTTDIAEKIAGRKFKNKTEKNQAILDAVREGNPEINPEEIRKRKTVKTYTFNEYRKWAGEEVELKIHTDIPKEEVEALKKEEE